MCKETGVDADILVHDVLTRYCAHSSGMVPVGHFHGGMKVFIAPSVQYRSPSWSPSRWIADWLESSPGSKTATLVPSIRFTIHSTPSVSLRTSGTASSPPRFWRFRRPETAARRSVPNGGEPARFVAVVEFLAVRLLLDRFRWLKPPERLSGSRDSTQIAV